VEGVQLPKRQPNSTHVFHQYTLLVKDGRRNELQAYLHEQGIPTMIYYPVPLYEQEAFKNYVGNNFEKLPVTEMLCRSVLSLPIHTEMDEAQLGYISEAVLHFFDN